MGLLAGCGSSSHSARTTTTAPTTASAAPAASAPAVDPQQLNSIPYDVGDTIGLPGGWRVQVTHVRRGYRAAGLPAAPAGQEYVAVDVRMIDDAAASTPVDVSKLFTLYDPTNNEHPVVTTAATHNALNGSYTPGTEKKGTLVFVAPLHGELRMIFEGEDVGSQRSLFQIDPPKTPQRD